jgi:hypothetical protein
MLDHLVYATLDLHSAVRDLERRLGVVPSEGGQHLKWGTRNFLLSLGGGSYLELIGPDPEQPEFEGVLPFGLGALTRPRLAGWAVRVQGIQARVEEARAKGYDPGPIQAMSRLRPDGVTIRWELTDPTSEWVSSLIPFFIDWGDSPHPSRSAVQGAKLVDFHAESPEPGPVEAALAALGVSLTVQRGNVTRLAATVEGPAGRMTLE